MWLMTKYGFYSIVQKKPNEFHVRSRERGDLDNLVTYVPLPEAEVSSSANADYAYRPLTPTGIGRLTPLTTSTGNYTFTNVSGA